MQMRMVAILMDDHEGLAVGKADLGHGGTAGLEHGAVFGGGLIGWPGDDEMGDQVLGLASGRLDAGCGFEGLGIGGGLCHARPSGIGALAVEEVGGVEAQIDGGDGGDPIAGLVLRIRAGSIPAAISRARASASISPDPTSWTIWPEGSALTGLDRRSLCRPAAASSCQRLSLRVRMIA